MLMWVLTVSSQDLSNAKFGNGNISVTKDVVIVEEHSKRGKLFVTIDNKHKTISTASLGNVTYRDNVDALVNQFNNGGVTRLGNVKFTHVEIETLMKGVTIFEFKDGGRTVLTVQLLLKSTWSSKFTFKDDVISVVLCDELK